MGSLNLSKLHQALLQQRLEEISLENEPRDGSSSIKVTDACPRDITNPPDDLVWQGRWCRIERWGAADWAIGFGHWEGAIEIHLTKWIIRFEPASPECC
ncbi:hypothetical protein J4E08_09965 [Sagittula sp. NFXS13]|uniref:hypothetical protein n=1 Tax=Sagittula sp. NFXS13 TaxID=2819095 RepID=UPI0032DFCC13